MLADLDQMRAMLEAVLSFLRLTMSDAGADMEIEDDGPGISDAAKETMLQPFVRGDDARNMHEAAGFGLGLSIAKAIVLAHGGVLSLHDRKPNGLSVRINLPREQQGRLSAAQDQAAIGWRCTSGSKAMASKR